MASTICFKYIKLAAQTTLIQLKRFADEQIDLFEWHCSFVADSSFAFIKLRKN